MCSALAILRAGTDKRGIVDRMKPRHLLTVLLAATATATAAIAGDSSAGTAESFLRTLYQDHQPWSSRAIAFDAEKTLSKYFDAELTTLFLEEDRCKERTRELCNLDADPIYCAQDFEGESLPALTVKALPDNEYSVSFSNHGVTTVVYSLQQTKAGWRVSDIQCPEGASLKTLLSQPSPQ
jgi:hypothetical protein